MKKAIAILTGIALCLAAIALSGCSQDKTSESKKVAETAIKALMKGDIKAYVDTYDLSDEDKAQLTSLLEGKLKPEIEKNGGIKSYEFVEEDINDEANTASYTVKLTYGDGTEKEETINLVKTDNGWKQKLNK